MHKFLVNLEKRIQNKRLKQFLYNKYYNIIDLYWNLFYTFWFGVAAGIGNAWGEPQIVSLFFQGFINNAYFGLIVNLFYARGVNYLVTKKHPYVYSISYGLCIQILFFLWHLKLGTENPFQAVLIPLVLGLCLTAFHVTRALGNKQN